MKERVSINLSQVRNDMTNVENRFKVFLENIRNNMKRIESSVSVKRK